MDEADPQERKKLVIWYVGGQVVLIILVSVIPRVSWRMALSEELHATVMIKSSWNTSSLRYLM